jgi:hypothetical protein
MAGLGVFLVLVAFLLGEGGELHPLRGHALASLQMAVFLVAMAGLVVGWRSPGIGGWMTVGGLAAFALIERLAAGAFPRGSAFLVMSAPGLLYLLDRALRAPRSGGRNATNGSTATPGAAR